MKLKAKTWNYCWPDDPQPGLLHLEPPALSGEATFWIQCGGGTSEEQDKIADRIAALWNMAERLGLTTEEIEEGVIQFAFELAERHAEVINAAKERIEKLEAEKADMLEALEGAKWLIDCYVAKPERYEEYQDVVKAIQKARG